MNEYANVILPLPLDGPFTYIVPPALRRDIAVGQRVTVPFGKRHFYTGIVESLSPVAPSQGVRLKEIIDILDKGPIVRPGQIEFWRWVADYYLCSLGEVYKAALPSGLKLESETRVEIDAEANLAEMASRTALEQEVLAYLSANGSTGVDKLIDKIGNSGTRVAVMRLVDDGLLCVSEKMVERYRAVRKSYVRLLVARNDPRALEGAFGAVSRSPRQEEALTALVALSNFTRVSEPLAEVPLDVLLDRTGLTRPAVKALADKGIAEIYQREVSRFSYNGVAAGPLPELSQAQNKALDQVHLAFREKDVVLLHGVTGSGKTEIYIHLIDYVLQHGRQALFLVPEIALTAQLTRRLQKVFGDKVLIYHSKFTDNERVDIWRRLLASREPLVVIGARSAMFLPFDRLGLVIVDEEHEASYKQFDPAPRYNGRDAATVVARMHGAKTLYGSATPSVETYYKASTGKFGLVSLGERYGEAVLPDIEIVDMKAERGRRSVSGYFSHRLLDATLSAVNKGKQAIFFHNRRGYAPMARCKMCAFVPRCNHCDVSLTYHKRTDRLVCHYCGAEYPVPQLCPECHEPSMEIVGYGTERLEDEIKSNFRDRSILRMDLDTTRNKESYSRIIDDFSAHKADILVGTQMVTKGLDFGDVAVVGVLNADMLVNYPDFRASERAFNMIEQVAGRAGRRQDRGKVLIQTYNPSHPLLDYVLRHDYLGFYEHELEERRAFDFPPFARVINIYLKHRESAVVTECALKYAASLRQTFGTRVSQPQEPPVGRVQSMYIRRIMLKIETQVSMQQVKAILRQYYVELAASPLMRGLVVYYDVDPA